MFNPSLIHHELGSGVVNPETGATKLTIQSSIGSMLLAKCVLDVSTPDVFIDDLLINNLGAYACKASMPDIAWFVLEEIENQLLERGVTSISVAPFPLADGSFDRREYQKTDKLIDKQGSTRPVYTKYLAGDAAKIIPEIIQPSANMYTGAPVVTS